MNNQLIKLIKKKKIIINFLLFIIFSFTKFKKKNVFPLCFRGLLLNPLSSTYSN